MIVNLTERSRIYAFLQRNSPLHLYGIGDMDAFNWPYTKWFGWESDGELQSVFFTYSGTELPVLIALEEDNISAANQLLRGMLANLPDKVYCSFSPEQARVMQTTFKLDSHVPHYKMILKGDAYKVLAINCDDDIQQLSPKNTEQLKSLYEQAYPVNWFDPRMLETGMYYGLFEANELIAVAGVHVYSIEYRVAALGNVTTHPDYRGKGLAKKISARLCLELDKTTCAIGLNVEAANAPAIAVYKSLGFDICCRYDEYMAHRR